MSSKDPHFLIVIFHWIHQHKWALLLFGIVALMLVSPVAEIYNERDDVITPLAAMLLLTVTFGTTERWYVIWPLAFLILIWFSISSFTEGSGLFAGPSKVAPGLFMFLLVAIFILLVRWLIRASYIGSEVLCAAICGYLMVGIIWTGFYTFVSREDPKALSLAPDIWIHQGNSIPISDLLYFSFTTLTTTGFGDITPTNPLIRMATVLEAIVGTFYNTIIIARFVGLYGVKRERPD